MAGELDSLPREDASAYEARWLTLVALRTKPLLIAFFLSLPPSVFEGYFNKLAILISVFLFDKQRIETIYCNSI